MESVKLVYKNGSYDYQKATSREMELIGTFLSSNVGSSWQSFKEFGKNTAETYTSGNTIYLEKGDNNNIMLGDLYEQEKNPTVVKFDMRQYLNLLDAWGEQVWSSRPHEVIIRYDNGQFSLETHV